jgi:5-methylcytosine-specific restriction protein A
MAAKAWRVCTNPDCPEIHQGQGRCPNCRGQADKARRPDGNPYGTAGHRRFRAAVLTRDPICTLCDIAVSTVADHHPLERKELALRGLDPDDPDRGRGLCKRCHDTHTAESNPAGWNRAF